MTGNDLIYAMGKISPELIADAAPDALPRKSGVKLWMRVVSVAACFILVFGAAVWLFVPYYGAREDSAKYITFKIGEGYHAAYIQIDEMSRFDSFTLESRIGDIYLEEEGRSLYKIKGQDDIAELIAVSSDGELSFFRFSDIVKEPDAAPFNFGFMLEKIYCVTAAEDIRSIVFEKDSNSKNEIYAKVKVDRLAVTDDEDISAIFDIFYSLEETKVDRVRYVSIMSEEYLNGSLPLSIQVCRKVTLNFKNGTSAELGFDPYGEHLSVGNTNYFMGFGEEDIAWLIEFCGINMEFIDYGTVAHDPIVPGVGDVTETPRPAE